MAVYTQKRFNNPETMRVNLGRGIIDGDGASVTITRAHIGSIISVGPDSNNNNVITGTIVSDKADVNLTDGKTYYLLAELPYAQDPTDYYFVGIILKSQYDVDNLIASNANSNDWALQYYTLRNTGVK